MTHAVIDEFSRIDEIKGQRARNVLSAARPRRQAVAAALAGCPPGEWLDVDALFTNMRRGNMRPTIARNQMALWKLYLGDAQYGSMGYDGYYRWEMLEGRYTLAVLFEYAGTLGLFDLDYIHPPRGEGGLPGQLGRGGPGLAEPLRRPAGDPAHRAGSLRTRPNRHLPATRR